MKPNRPKRRWLRLSIVSGMGIALAGWAGLSCCSPESFRQVSQAHPGRAFNQHVALVYSSRYQMNLGGFERMHSFDIYKYARIYLKLNTEGLIRPEDVFVPQPVGPEEILLVHTPEFLAGLKDAGTVARYIEAPGLGLLPGWLVDAGVLSVFRCSTGGTVLAGRLARQFGIAINFGGGYNHAKPDRGGGFNVYADVPIAIRAMQKEGLIKKALVVDLDVHQGNGQATCFAGDESVFTFSMHEGDIYPFPKAKSSLDVALPAGTGDEAYLATLRKHLPEVMDKARPEIVFYIAGCDALEGDRLGHLRLSIDGIVQRDAEVIDACAKSGIPVVMCLGGGYSEKAWEAQYQSIRRTLQVYGQADKPPHPPRRATCFEKWYTR